MEKRARVLELLRRFKSKGVPIHAVGLQSHLNATGPQAGAGLREFIREAAKMNLEVYVTEMDVNTHAVVGGRRRRMPPWPRFSGLFAFGARGAQCTDCSYVGITSAHSWLNQGHGGQSRRPDGTRSGLCRLTTT